MMRNILCLCLFYQIFLQLIFAQKADSNKVVIKYEQKIESKKGFQSALPKEAKLDSNRSGWNVKGQFEKKVYTLPNAGEIRFTTFISKAPYPDSTKRSGIYVYKDFDTLTFLGTIFKRTFYHPTRYTTVELVPTNSAGMQKYLDDREAFFRNFKWIIPFNIKTINIGGVGGSGTNTALPQGKEKADQNGFLPYDIFQKKDSILTTINKIFFEYAWRYSN